jgi:biopolymer transport protein ExbD
MSAQNEEQAIDLTPMLDVVFIMLIFFIVTATFIKETGAEVTPSYAMTANKQQVSVLVAITDNNEIWIDNTKVEPRSLRLHILRLRTENPQGGVVIQADKEANIDMLAYVADQAKAVGITNVSVATKIR